MRSIWVRAVWPAVAAAAAVLLAAGCSGGGSGEPAAGSSPGGPSVQTMDSFAACMRGHGVPNFYFSAGNSTPSQGSGTVLSFGGFQVTGVNPQTAQFQSGMKACRHIMGQHLPPHTGLEKQLQQMVKAAACMRSHGYPDWPDPSLAPDTMDGGQATVQRQPAGVDTSSPQFQKAAKACRL